MQMPTQPRLLIPWGLIAMAIWRRGGGPYSVDRKIGVEL